MSESPKHASGCSGCPCVCSQPRIDDQRLRYLIAFHEADPSSGEAEVNLALDLRDERQQTSRLRAALQGLLDNVTPRQRP